MQVKCPAQIVSTSGCVRNDESIQSSHDSTMKILNVSETSSSPMSDSARLEALNKGSVTAIALAAVLFLLISIIAGLWIVRRRRSFTSQKMEKDMTSPSRDSREAFSVKIQHVELPTQKEIAHPIVQELSPSHIPQSIPRGFIN